MGKLTFKYGGVRPPHSKSDTLQIPLDGTLLPEQVHIALNQQAGGPALPIVNVGDRVNMGDIIARSDDTFAIPIHASVPGRVTAIDPMSHVDGSQVTAITITRDPAAAIPEWPRQPHRMTTLDYDGFLALLRDNGVVGQGGAVFPTSLKLKRQTFAPLEAILINACECEPYIAVDSRAILEMSEALVEGIEILRTFHKNIPIHIGIEDTRHAAIRKLQDLFTGAQDIHVHVLKTVYPQGAEKLLVQAVLGLTVPRGSLPLAVGAVVLNAGTVIAIQRAVMHDQPLMTRMLTVAGSGIAKPANLIVPIGTPFSDIIAHCGGLLPDTERLIVGGPMNGFAQADASAAVLKSTTGLLALTAADIGDTREYVCIRCGACVGACPMRLLPTQLINHIRHGAWEDAQDFGLNDCMLCGSCSFSCPSRIPLAQIIREGQKKQEITHAN